MAEVGSHLLLIAFGLCAWGVIMALVGLASGSPAAQRSAERAGNAVTVQCVGNVATVTVTTPAEGWSVTRDRPGPADQVSVRFESVTVDPYLITVRSRCVDGIPRINFG